ncbi:hypothetical protein ILUMI_24451 [Ignelater luminosus]|uniref:Histone H4 transcription factor n=1 Tax=Ignelater luminosus TaxID=2038154 RepID=A0A8K0G0M4_IGNLU|nr:hypothetical protein ILUMI_24451 [Ignelater luminosus]
MSDIDQGSKQTKNRLAVFEHLPCKDKNPPKNHNFRKRFNRSLSPVSDTDLVIDEYDYCSTQPLKRRNRGVPMREEPLNLCCGWRDCSKPFTNFQQFVEHVNEHVLNIGEDSELFACQWENCTYAIQFYNVFRQHVCYHAYHTKLKNIGDNVVERRNLPKCTHSSDFIIPEEVNGYCCEWLECDAHFLLITDYFNHIRLHINSNPKYCKKGEIITCYWRNCPYKFTSQYKLSDHLRSHTKERVVACSTCGAMFATKTKFYDHRKRQLPIEMQSYQCSQCSKLFPSERLLRDHMRSHINHYKCTMCDMTCPKPSALATHIRYRHLTDRPLKCNLCEHSCISKQDLESHLLTHCSEKLVACEDCDFRCRSLYGLDKHYQKVHGQTWTSTYECHCCQKKFFRGNQLTQHLIKQHNFHWPSGHSRFRYKEDTDGIFRLQTVRYESIEVTQEMMRTNNNPPPSEMTNVPKYNLRKRQQSSDKTPNYVLMVAENGEQNVVYNTENSILITINDVDERGNIVNSEVLQSNEMKVMDSTSEEGRCLRSRKSNNKS